VIRLGHSTANWLKVATAIAILVTLAAMINAQGERQLRRDVQRNLSSLLEVIGNSIDLSYQQTIGEVRYAAAQPQIREAVQELLMPAHQQPAPPAAAIRQQLHQQLQPLLRSKGIRGFAVVAPDGRSIAASDDLDIEATLPAQLQPLTLARVWAGEAVITPPQPPYKTGQSPTMLALSPIRDASDAAIALLVLHLDPQVLLYRALQLGQTGRSGESYAFDRSGLMLSESRFDSQLRAGGILEEGQPSFRNIRISPPGSDSLTLMAASATAGKSGTNTQGYPDYRGVSVVGAWRWMVPYDFGIAVEADTAEAYSGLSLVQNALGGITLVACVLLVVIALISNRQKTELQDRVDAQTTDLQHEQAKLQSMFDTAPNGLITTDQQGLITDFSLCAEGIFGRLKRDMIGHPLAELFAEALPPLEAGSKGAHVQINARRPSGELVPVQLSLSSTHTLRGVFVLAIVRDISDYIRVEQTMREEIRRRKAAELRQRLLLDAAGEGIFGLDAMGRITFINPAGAQLLGYAPGELLGRRLTDENNNAPAICDTDNPLVQTGQSNGERMETTVQRRDGTRLATGFTRAPLSSDNNDAGAVVVFSDIGPRKRAEQSLLLAENVFQHITEGILVADASGCILRVNRALCAMVGYREQELIGLTRPPYRSGEHPPVFYQQLWDTLLKQGIWEGEIWNRRKDGEIFPTWQTLVAIRDDAGRPSKYVSVMRDITEQRRSEQRIHRLAYFDNLTGLPNRELFFDRFDHAIQRAQRQQQSLALLFLDLDRFKDVNDSLGHPVGDTLLKAVATRLQQLVRGEDTIARLGGDEFTILLESAGPHDSIAQVAQKVVQGLSQPFECDGHRLHIGTSVGISLFPADGDDATALVKHADAAMYQAKASGRNNYQFYSAALSTRTSERVALEGHLRRAIQNQEFVLHYQPQFAADGRIVGVEALIRWDDPVEGLIAPNRFIPLAEENGLIIPIGEWALRAACQQMRIWQAEGAPPISLSVNLAGPQIVRGNIVATVSSVLEETGLSADYLELEITETFVMEHVDQTVSILSGLRDLGVRIAIDDFGTGHSSLATLKRLPADTLKIDRAFVRDIPQDRNDMAIARAILAMGRELKLKTVAEGVETEEQREFLTEEGCDYFQGFLYSRPLPAAEVALLWQPRTVSRVRLH